jgi:hypothetical protein
MQQPPAIHRDIILHIHMGNNKLCLIQSVGLKRVFIPVAFFGTLYRVPEALLSELKIDPLICDTLRKYFQSSCQIQATEDTFIVKDNPIISYPFCEFIGRP